MNYLGHLFLCRDRPELMPGVFMGDHVKGPLVGAHEETIENGIRFHRTIDAHVDRHVVQQRSVARLPKHLRRFGGIICDVTYDFFLANHWNRFSDEEYGNFCERAYKTILDSEQSLNSSARRSIRRMAEYKSLEGYHTLEYIDRSLYFISQRLRFDNPLQDAMIEIEALRKPLESDFLEFLPSVDQFSSSWLSDMGDLMIKVGKTPNEQEDPK